MHTVATVISTNSSSPGRSAQSASVKSAKTSLTVDKSNFDRFFLRSFVVLFVLALLMILIAVLLEPWSEAKEVRITNITDRSATISWVTEEQTKGIVIYNNDDSFLPGIFSSVGQGVASDDRDTVRATKKRAESLEEEVIEEESGAYYRGYEVEELDIKNQKYNVHHVTITNLEPETAYYLRVGNGYRYEEVQLETNDNQGGNMSSEADFTTFAELDALGVPDPAYGLVSYWGDEARPVTDAVVYMSLALGNQRSLEVSSVLAPNGSWYLDLAGVRNASGEIFTASITGEEYVEISEYIRIQTGLYGEYEKTIYTWEDAPAETIEVAGPEEELLRSGVRRIDDQLVDDEGGTSIVSYVRAFDCGSGERVSCSVCVGGSSLPDCEKGCTYDANGEIVGCGFVQYCQERYCTQDLPGCECGCVEPGAPWSCSAGYECVDHKCKLPEEQEQSPTSGTTRDYVGCYSDGWGPSCCGLSTDVSAGGACIDLNNYECEGTIFHNKCPGGQNIKCCSGGFTAKSGSEELTCEGLTDGEYSVSVGSTELLTYWCCDGELLEGVETCPEGDEAEWCPDPGYFVSESICNDGSCGDVDGICVPSDQEIFEGCWWCDEGEEEEPIDGDDIVEEYTCEELEEGGPYWYIGSTGLASFFYCCPSIVLGGELEPIKYPCDDELDLTLGCVGSWYSTELGICTATGETSNFGLCHPSQPYRCEMNTWSGNCYWKSDDTCEQTVACYCNASTTEQATYCDWISTSVGSTWVGMIRTAELNEGDCKPGQMDNTNVTKESVEAYYGVDLNEAEGTAWTQTGVEILNNTYQVLIAAGGNKDLFDQQPVTVLLTPGTAGGLGGSNSITLHQGDVQTYDSGNMEGAIIHETTHLLDFREGENGVAKSYSDDEWLGLTGWTCENTYECTHPCIQIPANAQTGTPAQEFYCPYDWGDSGTLPAPYGDEMGDVSTNPQEDYAETTRHYLQNNDELSKSSLSRCQYMMGEFSEFSDHPCFDCDPSTTSPDCNLENILDELGSRHLGGREESLVSSLSETFHLRATDSQKIGVTQSQSGIGISSVFALEGEEGKQILLFPEEGLYAVEEGGVYSVELDKEVYGYVFIPSPGEYTIYIDMDVDDKYTEGVDLVVTDAIGVYNIGLSQRTVSNSYSLSRGFNMISFDLVNPDIGTMASDLMSYLNTNYGDKFYSIASYESGKWQVIENRNGVTYGADDFQIIPGRGYVVRAKDDLEVVLTGARVVDPVPVRLDEGWNLIAVHGVDSSYTAVSALEHINKVGSMTVDTMTEWSSARSRYVGVSIERDTTVYGFDYPIQSLGGYFVRVTEGEGTWIPD